jgi:hypothetical protein
MEGETRFGDGVFFSREFTPPSFFTKPGVSLDNIATIKMPLVFSFQRLDCLLACSYSACLDVLMDLLALPCFLANLSDVIPLVTMKLYYRSIASFSNM